jgi:hypothetical protein
MDFRLSYPHRLPHGRDSESLLLLLGLCSLLRGSKSSPSLSTPVGPSNPISPATAESRRPHRLQLRAEWSVLARFGVYKTWLLSLRKPGLFLLMLASMLSWPACSRMGRSTGLPTHCTSGGGTPGGPLVDCGPRAHFLMVFQALPVFHHSLAPCAWLWRRTCSRCRCHSLTPPQSSMLAR